MLPPVARRFLAGETSASALEHARRLGTRDVGAILNLLGEHYADPAAAEADAEAYRTLIDDVAATRRRERDRGGEFRACVSVKPTQIGLDVDEDCFRRNLDRIVSRAADRDVFVWLDMEDHTTTDATLDAYEHHARASGGVGVCVQANLRRTRNDLRRLAGLPGKVRLVKGAYDPPAHLAYRRSERVNEAFREDLRYMFRAFEDGVAVGSHDPAMVELARDLHRRHGTPFEVQMLMGVRTDAQYELARECPVWQYAPFGTEWLSYFYRRVAERRENLLFALRALAPGEGGAGGSLTR